MVSLCKLRGLLSGDKDSHLRTNAKGSPFKDAYCDPLEYSTMKATSNDYKVESISVEALEGG